MAILKQIKFGTGASTPIAKTIVNGKGVIAVTNTVGRKNDLTEQEDYSYDIDVNVDGTTIVKSEGKLAVGTVPAEKVSVAASAGLTATEAQAAFQELKSAINEVDGKAKSYTIVKTTEGLATNVKEQYKLQQTVGSTTEFVGEPIKIYKDSSLKEVYLGTNEDTVDAASGTVTKKPATDPQSMNFVYHLADGTYSITKIDVSKFLAESEFGKGLVVTDHVVSVKVDENSESFLTVGAKGVKLSGVQDAINAAVAGLDVTDAAVAGQYVSAVSETDGKVAISRANVSDAVLNGYAKGSAPVSGQEAVAATDDVKGAISKLEHQVDAAKAAATTKVVGGTDDGNNLTVVPTTSEADGSTTYTINLTDVASKKALDAEIAARKAVDGQEGQTYVAKADANYISGATSLNDADLKLDAALKTEEVRATRAEQEIAAKVNAIKYNVDGTTLIVVGIPKDETLKANKA